MVNLELSATRKTIVGVQFLFVAFSSTVLVPLLVGLDPATALFTAGIGTLLFHLVTKGAVPIFLGSSFAFIAPILSASAQWGMPGTIAAFAGVSLVYFLMSALIKWQGRKFINRLFPPVVIGPVIILIGLSLSPAAANMAKENWLLAFVSLITSILVVAFAKGVAKLVPVVIGIVVGYVVALCMGVVDLSAVYSAPWFALPSMLTDFHLPEFAWEPFVFMIPVAIAPVIEHIGDVYVVSAVAEKDFVKDPGLHRTMLGDGLACLFASFVGGPPVTTYSEVTGAMQITRVRSSASLQAQPLFSPSSASSVPCCSRFLRLSWAASCCCFSALSPRWASSISSTTRLISARRVTSSSPPSRSPWASAVPSSPLAPSP